MILEDAFSWLKDNSSFRRSIVEFIKKVVPGFEGKYHRFSKVEMNEAFQERVNKAKDAQELSKLIKTSTPHKNMAGVMNEFKAKVAKLKNK